MLNILKVNNKDTRTPLVFRIFDSIRHHSISSAFKNMFWKDRRCCCKIGSKDFNLTNKWLNSNQTKFQPKFNVFFLFVCKSNFLALIILQPEIVKLNVINSYILVDVVGVLALMQPSFLCGEVVNMVLWTFYFTMNCNNRNYYISVNSISIINK